MRLANLADRLVITPPGVGLGRTPPRWLTPGDELVSRMEGIGELRHRFVAAR